MGIGHASGTLGIAAAGERVSPMYRVPARCSALMAVLLLLGGLGCRHDSEEGAVKDAAERFLIQELQSERNPADGIMLEYALHDVTRIRRGAWMAIYRSDEQPFADMPMCARFEFAEATQRWEPVLQSGRGGVRSDIVDCPTRYRR